MAEDTNAILEQRLALMQQIIDKKVELGSIDAAERQRVLEMGNLLSQSKDHLTRMIDLRVRNLKLAQNEQGQASSAAKSMEQEIEKLKFVLAQREKLGATLDKRMTALKQENKLFASQHAHVKNVTDSLNQAVHAQAMYGLASATTAKKISNAVKGSQQEVYGLVPQAGDQIQGFWNKLKSVAGDVLGKVGGPALEWIAEKTGAVLAEQTNALFNAMSSTTAALDTKYRGLVKSVGFHSGQMKEMFLANMSGMTAELTEEGGFGSELKKLGTFMEDVYIDPAGSSDALQALYNSASVFHEEMDRGRNVTAGYISNMVAGFTKLGVDVKTSSSLINIASKALGKTPIGSVEFMKSIKNVGTALGKNVGETLSDFVQLGPKLTMFGDRVSGVFGKIAAQAKAAGMSSKDLLGIAMEFDTFEGAAKAAGQLNAVLGQTAIDAMSLVHADPDKKIEMIRKAVSDSVGEFADLDRRTKQVIAGIVAGGNVMQAQQMLSNKSSFEHYAGNIDKVTDKEGNVRAESNETLAKQMKAAGSISEIINGAAANMSNALNLLTESQRKISKGLYWTSDAAAALANNVARIPGAISSAGSTIANFFTGGQGFGGPGGDQFGTGKIAADLQAKLKALKFSDKEIEKMQEMMKVRQTAYFTAEAIAARNAAKSTEDAQNRRAKLAKANAEKARDVGKPGPVPTGSPQGFGGPTASVRKLSASMKNAVNADMLKFNEGLQAITASANALRVSLETISTSPALKNLASALGTAKPLEIRNTGKKDAGEYDVMAALHRQSATFEEFMKTNAATFTDVAMDRRTRTLIENALSSSKTGGASLSLADAYAKDKTALVGGGDLKPEPMKATVFEKTISNLKTESLVVQQQPAEMAALVGKIDKLVTKLEANTTAETKASTAVIEAMKKMRIQLQLDGRELKRTVTAIVEDMR